MPKTDPERAKRHGVRAVFFLLDVTTRALNDIGWLIDGGKLEPHVGAVLPLAEAPTAHRMLVHDHSAPVLVRGEAD